MDFIREGHSQAAIDGCYVCPMCRHQCTTSKATRRETDSPRSKALSLFGMQRGLLGWEGSGLVEQMYRCTGCQQCTTWCASRYEPAVMVQAARADIVQGLAAPPRVLELLDRIEGEGNPLGLPAGDRNRALDGYVPAARGAAEVLWYVGCVASYQAQSQVRATAALLAAAGVTWTVLPQENCCGALAWSLGFRQEAKEMGQQVLAGVAESGCGTVLTTCPTCFQALRRDYEKWGVSPNSPAEVVHVSQYLARLVDQGRLSFDRVQAGRVVYHDPCSLGRQMGVYDEPRRVLGAIPGVELMESRQTREKGECCGAGVGMAYVNPDIAAEAARQTLEGKLKTGATMVVTACPSCQVSFEGARDSLGAQVEVIDLATLAARSVQM